MTVLGGVEKRSMRTELRTVSLSRHAVLLEPVDLSWS